MSDALRPLVELPGHLPALAPSDLPDMDDDAALEPSYKDWEEYRDYIRHLRCCVCQVMRGLDRWGELVEPQGPYERLLLRISDPHHVKTRGAGGPDAGNLVPLCRAHHDEVGQMGRNEFEMAYNINLKQLAQHLFTEYLTSLDEEAHGEYACALYQATLTQLHEFGTLARTAIRVIGQRINEFRQVRGGRRLYEWLGFASIDSWMCAPVLAGGLGINARTGYRYALFANLLDSFREEAPYIERLGPNKAAVLAPLLERAETGEERMEHIRQAEQTAHHDLGEYVGEKLGRTTRRERSHQRIVQTLREFLAQYQWEVMEEELEGLAWRLQSVWEGRWRENPG